MDIILDYLKNKTRDGTEEPFHIYLSCYQVPQVNDGSRAAQLLDTAYQLLQQTAERISSAKLRNSFLQNAKAYAKIVSEWKELHAEKDSTSRLTLRKYALVWNIQRKPISNNTGCRM